MRLDVGIGLGIFLLPFSAGDPPGGAVDACSGAGSMAGGVRDSFKLARQENFREQGFFHAVAFKLGSGKSVALSFQCGGTFHGTGVDTLSPFCLE